MEMETLALFYFLHFRRSINILSKSFDYFDFLIPQSVGVEPLSGSFTSSRWRRSSGHSMGDYSSESRESLVHRVCKQDKSLASSGIQVSLVENLGSTGSMLTASAGNHRVEIPTLSAQSL